MSSTRQRQLRKPSEHDANDKYMCVCVYRGSTIDADGDYDDDALEMRRCKRRTLNIETSIVVVE